MRKQKSSLCCTVRQKEPTRNKEAYCTIIHWPERSRILALTLIHLLTHIHCFTHTNLLFPQEFLEHWIKWTKSNTKKMSVSHKKREMNELKHVCHQICDVELACTTILWLCIICACIKGTVDTCTWYTPGVCIYV